MPASALDLTLYVFFLFLFLFFSSFFFLLHGVLAFSLSCFFSACYYCFGSTIQYTFLAGRGQGTRRCEDAKVAIHDCVLYRQRDVVLK